MKQRLLITGYGGFVAGSAIWQAGPKWEVFAFSRSKEPTVRANFCSWKFDLCDKTNLRETFAAIKPDAVIHAAALANIDYCQSHQDEAERVNVATTKELAELCTDHGAKLVFCSTDSVFDGTGQMYSEEDEPNAVNFYAETKIRAEQAVRKYAEQYVVARLSLVIGLPVLGAGNSFLAKMISLLDSGQQVLCPENEIRTPVDVITLGQSLLELAGNDFSGTLHLAGHTRVNRYKMALLIADRLKLASDLIVATDSNEMAKRARRPNDVSLNNTLACQVLDTPMKNLMDGLDLIVSSKGQ